MLLYTAFIREAQFLSLDRNFTPAMHLANVVIHYTARRASVKPYADSLRSCLKGEREGCALATTLLVLASAKPKPVQEGDSRGLRPQTPAFQTGS